MVTGVPLSGASVKVFFGNFIVATTIAAEDGSFCLCNLNPARYTIKVSAKDFQSISQLIGVKSNQTTTIDLNLNRDQTWNLDPVGCISGQVVDASTDTPITEAVIDVLQENAVISSALTDIYGHFVLSGLAPGNYTVRAVATDFQIVVQEINVEDCQTAVADFGLLSQPGNLTGQVFDATSGTSLSNVVIDVLQENRLIASALTDVDGSYTISGLAPDNFLLKASAADFQTTILGASIQENETLSAHFVLNPNTEAIVSHPVKPIPKASVQIFQKRLLKHRILQRVIIRTNFAPHIDCMHRSKWPSSLNRYCWLFQKR